MHSKLRHLWSKLSGNRRTDRPRIRRRRGLRLEPLDGRRLLTTFFVDGAAADGGTGAADAPFNTIQAAVDAASAAPGPDAVRIAPGVYDENVKIEDVDRLRIDGNGATVTSQAGIGEHTIEIVDSSDVMIQDLSVTGGDDGINAENMGRLTLLGVHAVDNDDEGIEANEVGSVRLVDVHVMNNSGDGLAVEGADNVRIAGGSFDRNDDGIQLDFVNSVRLTNVVASENDDEGVAIGDAHHVIVVGADFTLNGGDGLAVESAQDVSIIGGTFNGNDDGIDLEAVTDVSVWKATAIGNANEGLEVDDGDDIQVVGGYYSGNAEAGLDIDNTIRINVINVTAVENGVHGLQVEAEDDFTTIESVIVTNGVFRDNTGDGIHIVEESPASVTSVQLTNVLVADNMELEPGVGGHGLFIDVSGDVQLFNVVSEGNDNPDVTP